MRRIGPGSADDELHAARIRAKRARYAADVAALVVGKPAEKLARRVAGVQEVLGNHQDACVAREWLRRVALDVDAPVAVVAGELAAVQDAEALACRHDLAAAWERATKSKLRSWLTR
jgi:CHAD domain-containing protein